MAKIKKKCTDCLRDNVFETYDEGKLFAVSSSENKEERVFREN